MSESSNRSGGVGLPMVLLAVFITLKLTDNIAWSWVWVLSPLWISLILVLVLLVIAALLGDR